MKDNYVNHVLEEYIEDENFDALFGDDWIDHATLWSLPPRICDYAFAGYGIDARGSYAGADEKILENLIQAGAIARQGDEYSDFWYRLRPAHKQKLVAEHRTKNSATSRVKMLGEEALRRALDRIVQEDDLRSLEERWLENSEVGPREEDPGTPANIGQLDLKAGPDMAFFRSDDRKEAFLRTAENEIEQVAASDLSNAQKSQAVGFLTAAKALAETPEPPVDLIWTILNRASAFAGIGSFFISLITLIVMAAS